MTDTPDVHLFDVVVIGAGIAGASAAAALAAHEPDRRVALIEAEEVAGYHSTGRSAALFLQNYGPPDVRALSAASRAHFQSPPPGFADAALTRPRPWLLLAPPGQEDALTAMLGRGEGLREVPLAAAAAMLPPLRPDYAVAAAVEDDAFDIDVAALHQGFLRAFRRAGGTLALRARAGRVARSGRCWQVAVLGGAEFAAPVLVNASGAWGDEVAALAGVAPVGLQPKRRTGAIIHPAPWLPEDWPTAGDVAHTWYMRPEARTRLMVSPADETDVPPQDIQPDDLDVAVGIDRMQQALDIEVRRVERSWAGLRSFTPDRSFALGWDAAAEGFLWCVGQGGYGIQTAPAAGRLVADLVAGGDGGILAPVVARLNPARFARVTSAA